jgi:hypothetical protein
LTIALCGLLLAVHAVTGQEARFASPLTDADTMKAALHTNTREENFFIDNVLDLVEQGVLPRDMVYSTFLWARKKPRHKFQYFRFGLLYRISRMRPPPPRPM